MKRFVALAICIVLVTLASGCGAFDEYAKKQAIIDATSGMVMQSTAEITPTVTNGEVKIKRPGTYRLKGNLRKIKIVAGDEDDVTLILDNVTIRNNADFCIHSKYCKLLTIVAVGENHIIMEDEDKSSAIKAKTDIAFEGDGTITIESQSKGIKGEKTFTQNGAALDIKRSTEGVEAMRVIINGGKLNIIASDDGINATDFSGFDLEDEDSEDVFIKINGGDINIDSRGDGVDSNGGLYFNGGNTRIAGPEDNGNSIIDYSTEAVITGGTLLGTGSGGMMEYNDSDKSTQNVIVNFLEETMNAGDSLDIVDGEGNVYTTVTLSKKTEAYIYSAPEVQKSEIIGNRQQRTGFDPGSAPEFGPQFGPGPEGGQSPPDGWPSEPPMQKPPTTDRPE